MNKEKRDMPRINKEITSKMVRLIDEHGEMKGVVSLNEALGYAHLARLDLVEISDQDEVSVCKIVDYGKYRYEQQKKEKELRKKNKPAALKELTFRPTIDEHAYLIKMKQARQFIDHGDKIKFSIKFRGREISHQELGMRIIERIQKELESVTKVEQAPSLDGKQVIMILASK